MNQKTQLYKVTYDGLWLGGVALVYATSSDEAIAQVAGDSKTIMFKNPKAELLPETGVVYNDNGDY